MNVKQSFFDFLAAQGAKDIIAAARKRGLEIELREINDNNNENEK